MRLEESLGVEILLSIRVHASDEDFFALDKPKDLNCSSINMFNDGVPIAVDDNFMKRGF